MMSSFPSTKPRQYTSSSAKPSSKRSSSSALFDPVTLPSASSSKRVYTSVSSATAGTKRAEEPPLKKRSYHPHETHAGTERVTETKANRHYVSRAALVQVQVQTQQNLRAQRPLLRPGLQVGTDAPAKSEYTVVNKGKLKEEGGGAAKLKIDNLPATLLWLRQKEGVFKCWARDVEALDRAGAAYGDRDLFFFQQRWPVVVVELVGLIVGVTEGEKQVSYLVDDGTSVLNCIQPFEAQPTRPPPASSTVASTSTNPYIRPPSPAKPASRPPTLKLFTSVRVSGKVSTKWEERCLSVSTISPTPSPSFDAESAHHLLVGTLHRERYSKDFVLQEWKPSSPSKTSVAEGKDKRKKKKVPRLRVPSKLGWEKLQPEHLPVYLMAHFRSHNHGGAVSKSELVEDRELWGLARRLVAKEMVKGRERERENKNGAVLSPSQAVVAVGRTQNLVLDPNH
ncbi:hypothetical protein BT69DRAFT_1281601, partial [Atractiella rhizophila]